MTQRKRRIRRYVREGKRTAEELARVLRVFAHLRNDGNDGIELVPEAEDDR